MSADELVHRTLLAVELEQRLLNQFPGCGRIDVGDESPALVAVVVVEDAEAEGSRADRAVARLRQPDCLERPRFDVNARADRGLADERLRDGGRRCSRGARGERRWRRRR